MKIRQLIRHFATREIVPIQVEEVVEVVRSWGVKDDVFFWDVDTDVDIMKGQIVAWESPWNDGTIKYFADISTARILKKQRSV